MQELNLYCFGITGEIFPVVERELWTKREEEFLLRNQDLVKRSIVQEILTLSTCNRIEYYCVSSGKKKDILSFLSLPKNSVVFEGSSVVDHLLGLSAGLKSPVLGENEILCQIKEAYAMAHKTGLTGKILNLLFQKAISVGKKVRTETNIAKNSVSIGGIILDKIKREFVDLANLNVLLLGAGKISRSVGISLKKRGVKKIFLTNRNLERAEILAQEMQAYYFSWNHLNSLLKDCDVLISSTKSPYPILTKKSFDFFLDTKSKKNRQKLLFDLAVPRNIEHELGHFDGISLVNIDEILKIAKENSLKRKDETYKAEEIIFSERERFLRRFLEFEEHSFVGNEKLRI